MRKIIVTAGLAVALVTSTSIAAHEHIKVEQLREDVSGLQKLIVQRESQLNNQIQELDSALNNYSVLNEQLENELSKTNEKLGKTKQVLENTEKLVHEMKAVEVKKKQAEEQAKVVQAKMENKQPSRSNTGSTIKTVYVTATAYTAYCNGCSGTTATGIDLRKNPGLKVIAVDPNVIPLGSKVHVEGYGYAIAGDTGGAIKGNKIDLFVPSQSKAMDYGKQKGIKVQILTEK